MRPINRVTPNLPSHLYTTFSVSAPLSTHFRKATCVEVECAQYANGWRVRIEGLPLELLHQARNSGRVYKEVGIAEGETYLVFSPNQPCFKASQHQLRVTRPEVYTVRPGDYRNLGRPRVHSKPEFWVEEFQENQQKLADKIGKE